MKTKTIIVLITAIFFILTISPQSTAQKTKSDQTNKSEVKVINNPGTPLYGKIILEIEEDLSIGNEDDNNYALDIIIKIEVDNNGNIIVLDQGNNRVLQYDKTGQFIIKFGRAGEGPGEFIHPRDIFIDLNGNIIIQDSYKLHTFNNKGIFKENINISFDKFVVTPAGYYLGKLSSTLLIDKIVLISKEEKIIKTIVEVPNNNYFQMKKRAIRLENLFYNKLEFAPLNKGFGVFFFSNECKLHIINPSGDISKIIKTKHPVELLTKKEKRKLENKDKKMFKALKLSKSEIKEYFNFPKNKPTYEYVLDDDQDRIYAEKWKATRNEPKETTYYLFSKEGRFLYEIISPVYFDIIRDGYIYNKTTDPDKDIAQVKRYKIKNWDKIKAN